MVIGNTQRFAIASHIHAAYKRRSLLALGSFNIYVDGVRYGSPQADATFIACSYDAVIDRLKNRGRHSSFVPDDTSSIEIARSFYRSVYAPDTNNELIFGMDKSDFVDHIFQQNLFWAPDGDSAFDDGSFVIQMDIGDKVRLIGFKSTLNFDIELDTLREIWLEDFHFYSVLESWVQAFEAEWASTNKLESE